MKKNISVRGLFYALGFATFTFTSCEKNEAAVAETPGDSSDASLVAATIAVAASASAANPDSVSLVQPCKRGSRRDSVAQADLPAAVTSYLSANYSGSHFHKAYAIKDAAGAISGYAVVVYYNDKPVGLEFDAAGTFVKVLEQRERNGGRGGRRFQGRDGKGRDTVALGALPAAITGYFAANYSTDTLLKAYKTADSSYLVLSKNGGVFATVFDAAGTFVKRSELSAKGGNVQTVEQTALPASITAYLNSIYPAYTFHKAFAVTEGTAVAGYIVVIDANNTKYAVAFDAAGTFISAKTLH